MPEPKLDVIAFAHFLGADGHQPGTKKIHEIGTNNLVDAALKWSDSDIERWLPKPHKPAFYERQKKGPSVSDALNQLCRDLPQGYRVQIIAEKESGWVDLIGPDGAVIDFPSNRETLPEQLDDAYQHAVDLASGRKSDG